MADSIIWTIGYEAAGFRAFLAALDAAGVKRVIDVRDLPRSRRAGFSKRILAGSLAAAGIDYVHLKALGTPKAGRQALRRRDRATFWAIFEARLDSPESAADLARAAALATERPSALLCFEANPETCHRRRIGELLAEQFGFRVRHLTVAFGAGTAPH